LAVTGTPQLDARVVWNGFKHESQWDVAVLHIHDPSQVPDLVQRAARPLLSLREIGDGEAWSARGAFRASLVVDTTGRTAAEADDFGGKTFGSTDKGIVTLTTTDHPKDPKGWRGASGSAVTRGRELLAVVRSYPEAWDGTRLRATVLAPLRKVPQFLDQLGLSEVFRRIDALSGKVAAILAPHQDLLARLATSLALDSSQDRHVADALCRLASGLELLGKCHPLLNQYVGESALRATRADCEAAKALESVVLLLVPRLLGPAVTEALRQVTLGSSSALLPLRWVTKTVIELEMAALDERAAEFEKETPVGREPKGKYLVPDVPDVGMGEDALAQAVAAVAKDLASKVLSPTIIQKTPTSKLAGKVDAMLEACIEDELPERYLYFIASSTWSRAFTAALSNAIPHLKVCCLGTAGDEQDDNQDQRLANLVTRILTLKQRREQLCPANG
jgi:hypothetical protein